MLARAALVVLAAGLYAAALPPWNVVPVGFVALLPFLTAVRAVGVLPACGLGLLFGTLAIWGVGWWVPSALAHYYQQSLGFGIAFAFGASVVFAGSYTAGFAASVAWLGRGRTGLPRAGLIACLWVAWELARARLLTGDPWLLLGYALGPAPALRQGADVGGVYLLSALLAFASAAVEEAYRGRWKAVVAAAAAVLAAGVYGQTRLATSFAGDAVTLAIVQGNNPVGTQWQEEDYGSGLDRYLELSSAATASGAAPLLVWPESAVTFFLADDRSYQATIGRMLAATGAELIVGGPFKDGERYFNSAFHVTADGRIRGRYDKTHLLPFAEYFPLRTVQFLRRRFERAPYFTPGDAGRLVETRLGPVAIVICFEAIFPEIVRARMAAGGRLLVNLSNDAWLGTGPGREQHLAMAALRAVESRAWVVRATTTGISALVDPHGSVVARAPADVPAVLAGSVVPLAVATVYEAVGDAFAYGCLAVVVLVALGRAIGAGRGTG